MENKIAYCFYLKSHGYTNLRVEEVRTKYILADKDGRTYCFLPYQIEAMMAND